MNNFIIITVEYILLFSLFLVLIYLAAERLKPKSIIKQKIKSNVWAKPTFPKLSTPKILIKYGNDNKGIIKLENWTT